MSYARHYCHRAPRVPCMRRNYNNSSAFVSPRINIPKALQLILAKGIFIYFDLFSKKKKKRETDSSERWKDSEVDRWSLSKWRHSASVRYITDEKREDSNMNAPVLTSTSARGLPCALETLPCGVEIHVRALTRKHDVHRGAHVCIMYVSCKYSYAYMDVHSPVSPPIHLPTCLLYLQSKDSKPQLSLSYELPTRLISTRAPWRLL